MTDVVAAAEGGTERKVMIAIDESDNSYYALMWVLDNLKESILNFPLVIFMAQPPKYNYTFAAPLGAALLYCSALSTSDFVNSTQENSNKLTFAYLEKAKEICAGRGVNAEIVTEEGDAKTLICDAVQKLNINLLVLGDEGLGKIKRTLIGSVSNYCVLNAKCSVLIVRQP